MCNPAFYEHKFQPAHAFQINNQLITSRNYKKKKPLEKIMIKSTITHSHSSTKYTCVHNVHNKTCEKFILEYQEKNCTIKFLPNDGELQLQMVLLAVVLIINLLYTKANNVKFVLLNGHLTGFTYNIKRTSITANLIYNQTKTKDNSNHSHTVHNINQKLILYIITSLFLLTAVPAVVVGRGLRGVLPNGKYGESGLKIQIKHSKHKHTIKALK
ncbi:hypothetical protein AGLY_015577 [Aphis glycines]|uniref:Uncharacterized protein n=1 Tax=Aphis glycines TaxID=307491 RepID=A0A6G0SZV5_APHGL|nr:hypothetical protein AGLY_015577 [Aphis glycines]